MTAPTADRPLIPRSLHSRDWQPPKVNEAEVDVVIDALRKGLDDPRIGRLPWRYAENRIDGRIFPDGHIFCLDGKTFARSAVNALPLLFAEIARLREVNAALAKVPSHD